jgi:hypothetical protein
VLIQLFEYRRLRKKWLARRRHWFGQFKWTPVLSEVMVTVNYIFFMASKVFRRLIDAS